MCADAHAERAMPQGTWPLCAMHTSMPGLHLFMGGSITHKPPPCRAVTQETASAAGHEGEPMLQCFF